MGTVRQASSVAECLGLDELLFRCPTTVARFILLLLFFGMAWSNSVLAQEKQAGQKQELARFQGPWRAVAGERDGQLRPKVFLDALTVVIRDDIMILQVGKRRQTMRLVVDPSRRPKTIDLVHLEGKEKGEVWLGIYQLEPNRVKLCVSEPGRPRPDDFLTRPGLGRELLILERQTEENNQTPR